MNNKKNKKIRTSLNLKSINKSVKNKHGNGIKIKNGIKSEINGWKCITIKGAPHARGYAHGQLLKKEMEEIRDMLKYSLYEDYGRPFETFIEISNDFFTNRLNGFLVKSMPLF